MIHCLVSEEEEEKLLVRPINNMLPVSAVCGNIANAFVSGKPLFWMEQQDNMHMKEFITRTNRPPPPFKLRTTTICIVKFILQQQKSNGRRRWVWPIYRKLQSLVQLLIKMLPEKLCSAVKFVWKWQSLDCVWIEAGIKDDVSFMGRNAYQKVGNCGGEGLAGKWNGEIWPAYTMQPPWEGATCYSNPEVSIENKIVREFWNVM